MNADSIKISYSSTAACDVLRHWIVVALDLKRYTLAIHSTYLGSIAKYIELGVF